MQIAFKGDKNIEDFIVKNKKEIFNFMLERGDSKENREIVLEIGKILNNKQNYETLVQMTLNPDQHEKK